jgi:crossover junction endodeoxyribonuclease RuvC
MVVLGIDPGIANTGYGLIEADGTPLRLIDYGTITTDSQTESPHRLKSIYDRVNHLASEYQPDFFVFEDLFFSKNVSSALAVGEARGIAKLVAANMGREVFGYTPAHVKQSVVGYGKASKRQIQEMVKTLLKLDTIPHPDHAADALAVAICHARSYKMLQLRERCS